jgi:DNA-binding CsgD family transcriptional regulator
MRLSTAELAIRAGKANLRVVAPMPAPPRPAPTVAPGRPGLFTALDLMGQSLGIYNRNGMLLRQTGAFERAIDDAVDRDALTRLIRASAAELFSRVSSRPGGYPAVVALQHDGYVARASLYQPGDEPLVLVHLEIHAGTLRPMTDSELRMRYGFTNAELRVARLVGEGKSNKYLAAALGVSEHTTRHHTERVLRKLGVRSRSEVSGRLLSSS